MKIKPFASFIFFSMVLSSASFAEDIKIGKENVEAFRNLMGVLQVYSAITSTVNDKNNNTPRVDPEVMNMGWVYVGATVYKKAEHVGQHEQLTVRGFDVNKKLVFVFNEEKTRQEWVDYNAIISNKERWEKNASDLYKMGKDAKDIYDTGNEIADAVRGTYNTVFGSSDKKK
jgi:hypothetical protein